jgi:hypothetical protein
MKHNTRRLPFRPLALFIALALPGIACAQEGNETAGGRVFTPADFARFAPTNAMDMLNQVPGFAVRNDDDQGRGLGQASTNVLINGERVVSKSQGVFDQLSRITAENVIRIEIVDGATMQIPGLSGQVANIITKGGAISGRYQYRTIHRPKYAQPLWFGGDVSVSGSSPQLEWNAAYNHSAGRGASGGSGWLTDGAGKVTELRDIRQHFEGEYPRLSGSLKWNSPSGTITNFNAIYNTNENANAIDEVRDPVAGVGYFRDSGNGGKGHGYEIGGDVDFKLGPGRLKLIGLDRGNQNKSQQLTLSIFDDNSPTTGSRFAGESETGERIGRAEYRWDAWGGNWQLDGEAAFNEFEQTSHLFTRTAAGTFTEIPLPRSSGEVTEDRYEVILTHGRMFSNGLSMQLGAGAENSELAQTGPGGLTREFWRPKGSLTLGWTPHEGLDLSLKIARTVGQLSFGDFLSSVSLQQSTANAGNAQLKPTLSWTSDFEIKQNLGAWGSTTLTLYGKWHDDYIDVIPLPGGGESSGNIDNARVYGVTWTNTVNLDPIGWGGTKLNVNITMEDSEVEDPLTRLNRSFSYHYDRRANANIRRDIPASNWAWGFGVEYTHSLPYYRLSEIGREYEGPAYTFAFIERKNLYGMTVNFNVFNLSDGRAIYHRTVYTDRRNNSPVSFTENRDLSVQPIFRLQVTGNF